MPSPSSLVCLLLLPLATLLSFHPAAVVHAQPYTVFGVVREIDEAPFITEQELADLESQMPTPITHGWFQSVSQKWEHDKTKAQLHYREWYPQSTDTKAVVIFTHGIQTHGGKSHSFPDTAQYGPGRDIATALITKKMLAAGYAVYAMDIFGHGYSEGERFYIDSYENQVQDLINFIRIVADKNPSQKIFLMAESWGANLSLHAAHYYQRQQDANLADQAQQEDGGGDGGSNPGDAVIGAKIESLLLIAPAVEVEVPCFPQVELLTVLSWCFPRCSPDFMPNPVSADRIWRDPQVLELFQNPDYAGNKISGDGQKLRLGTAVEALAAATNVREFVIPNFKKPFVVAHGRKDEAVLLSGSEFLYQNVKTPDVDKLLLYFDNSFHDLLAEPEGIAEQVVQDFINWIQQRLASDGPILR